MNIDKFQALKDDYKKIKLHLMDYKNCKNAKCRKDIGSEIEYEFKQLVSDYELNSNGLLVIRTDYSDFDYMIYALDGAIRTIEDTLNNIV